MLDLLPFELVVRIGELGRWNRETFLALSQVSKKYHSTVMALGAYARRFDLIYDGKGNGNADMTAPETISDLCFIDWETNNPQVARPLSPIVHCLTLNGSRSSITNEDVSTLGGVCNLTLLYCDEITDVSALGGVHNLSLRYCPGIRDMSALGGVHNLSLRFCERITDVSALRGHYDFVSDE